MLESAVFLLYIIYFLLKIPLPGTTALLQATFVGNPRVALTKLFLN